MQMRHFAQIEIFNKRQCKVRKGFFKLNGLIQLKQNTAQLHKLRLFCIRDGKFRGFQALDNLNILVLN